MTNAWTHEMHCKARREAIKELFDLVRLYDEHGLRESADKTRELILYLRSVS